MPWPSHSDYVAAIENARTAFRCDALQSCRIEQDEFGEPLLSVGGNSLVVKAIPEDGSPPLAIRLFDRDRPLRAEHYERLAAHLQDRKLSCLVGFAYDEAGIHVADLAEFPLLVMDWVDGAPLADYIRARCLANRGTSVAKAARHWIALANELTNANLSHGRLESRHLLITRSGRLKLIDYESLCTPETDDRSPAGDRFATLAIYVALRALAADVSLWARHVEPSGQPRLLFASDDFRDPSASAIFADLDKSPDEEVRKMAHLLAEAALADENKIPLLNDLLVVTSEKSAPKLTPPRAPKSVGARVILQAVSGPIHGQTFVFDRHDTFLLGRGKDCHARIPGDPWVSRHHFLLEVVPPRIRLRDLASRNGTYVNGRRFGVGAANAEGPAGKSVVEVDLNPGDEITVGETTILVRVESGFREGTHPPEAPTSPAKATRRKPSPGAARVTSEAKGPGIRQEIAAPAAPSVGLAAYAMGESIGRGPLGTVYRAIRKSDGQLVAVKLVRPSVAVADDIAQRFLKNIAFLRDVSHPNIAAVSDLGWHESQFYFVTHYFSAKNLSELARNRNGRLSMTSAHPLLAQCLQGLEYAHQLGIIHRSLKPENILVENRDGAWSAAISDFALAQQFELAGLSSLSNEDDSRPGLPFMPRERLTGFQNHHPTSDLWSLAATFYRAISGHFPHDFEGRDPWTVILHKEVVPIAERDPSIAPPLASVFDTALQSDPSARFPSAQAMLDALDAAFQQPTHWLR